jgi:hypothetical protein
MVRTQEFVGLVLICDKVLFILFGMAPTLNFVMMLGGIKQTFQLILNWSNSTPWILWSTNLFYWSTYFAIRKPSNMNLDMELEIIPYHCHLLHRKWFLFSLNPPKPSPSYLPSRFASCLPLWMSLPSSTRCNPIQHPHCRTNPHHLHPRRHTPLPPAPTLFSTTTTSPS